MVRSAREAHVSNQRAATRIVFPSRGRAEAKRVDLPDSLGPDEVLLRTSKSLISAGTELALFSDRNELRAPGKDPYPQQPGYAAVGTIEAVGEGIDRFSPGDRVFAATPHASACVFSPARTICIRLPDDVSDERAVFVRMALITLAALCRADIQAGEWLGVVGLGIVGNLGAQLGREAGYHVVGVGRSQLRSERAAQCGIDPILEGSAEEISRRVRDLTGGHGCRFVLDTSGTSGGVSKATAIAAAGGTISLVGVPWETDTAITLSSVLQPMFSRYLKIQGGWEWDLPLHAKPDDTPAPMIPFRHSVEANARYAVELIRCGSVVTDPLVTQVLEPERAQEAYDGLATRRDEYLGVVFDWSAV